MSRALRWIWGLWRELHEEHLARDRTLDWRPLVILVTTATSLALQEFFGDRGTFRTLFDVPLQYVPGSYNELWSFVWWSAWRVFGYLVLPAAVIALLPGERLRDLGWSIAGFTRHLKTYVALYLAVLPLVWLASQTAAFQHIYPFYKLASRSAFDFWAWQALYAVQFLALEFFFRGFLIHGLKRAIGVHAIWVSMVPYAMIHFGKTFTETMAAVVAGLVLGTVSLRTRSIWGGVVIHVAVGLTMDALTLLGCKPTYPFCR